MNLTAINFQEKLAKFSEYWSPKIIAQMNDCHFKLAKIKGDFVWHSHSDTDEVFMVLGGNMTIEFHDGKVELHTGEMVVIPRGLEHKPHAREECQIILVTRLGTVNTGNTRGDLTVEESAWI